MTGYQVLGAAIIAAFFLALFAFIVREEGWAVAFGIFGFTVVVCGALILGTALLTGALP